MFTSVWTKTDRLKLTALSLLWLFSVAAFWKYWLHSYHAGTAWGMPVISIVAAWPFAVMAFVIFFLHRMKRVSGERTPYHLRVAMVVTKAPSEPLTVVKRTLTAALKQEHPHDTWVADEDPTPQALKWYKKNGVHVSCRKDVTHYHNEVWPRRTKCKEGNLAYFYDMYGYDRYDVVVQMDVDHAPKPGYLAKMVQPFANRKVGYVTAPSVCDANYSRSWSARARAQADSLFQGPVQAGSNDGWVTKCIGSHYAVRTAALKKIGGLGPELAEDYTTTLMLNAKGYIGVSALDADANGDGPHSFGDIVVQDYQWARSLFTVLLTIFPKHFRRLNLRQKLQFTFTQLWYPVSALVWLAAVVVPIVALATGEAPVNVHFTEFAAFYSLPFICALFIYVFAARKGHMRPKEIKFISWEMFLFELARWPWVIIALIDSLLALVREKTHMFKITAKRPSKACLPAFTLTPYILVVAASVLAIIYRADQGTLTGYYWFTVGFGVAYALLIAIVALLHIGEMVGAPTRARTLSHVPHFITSMFMVAIVATSAFISSVGHATAMISPAPVSTSEAPVVQPEDLPDLYIGVHTVQEGESLWAVAESLYGDGALWTRFQEREYPDRVQPGELVRSPLRYHQE